MCARYTLVTPPDELIEEFEATLAVEELPPQHNIAPTDRSAIVVQSKEGERRIGLARFGMIPHWAKSARQGVKMLNARVETVATSKGYGRAFARRRCLVVADGFYEWEHVDGEKLPYRFHLDGRPFGFAGLWAVWDSPEGEKVTSFTILTRPAIGETATIHDRMPILVPRDGYATWLDRGDVPTDVLMEVLAGHRGAALHKTRVSKRVNDVRQDDPSLIEPVA